MFLGQRARIVVESFKDKAFEGKVTKISPLRRREGQRHDLRGACLHPELHGELKTNMTANAEIILEEKKGVLLVPETALVYDKERSLARGSRRLRADGKRKVAVKVGISNGVKAEIVEGSRKATRSSSSR